MKKKKRCPSCRALQLQAVDGEHPSHFILSPMAVLPNAVEYTQYEDPYNEYEELWDIIDKLKKGISERQSLALKRYYIYEDRLSQVGRVLGITKTAAHNNIKLAIKKLRDPNLVLEIMTAFGLIK